MPRGVKKSNLDTLKQHGEKILAALQVEINRKEKENLKYIYTGLQIIKPEFFPV